MAKKEFEANEKIHIELISGREIEGEFVLKNLTSIIVKNSKDLLHGKQYRHSQTFFLSEIKKYYAVGDRERSRSSNENAYMPIINNDNIGNTGNNISNSRSNNNPSIEIVKKTFCDVEIEHIENLMKNPVYISQFDNKYHDAINDMKRQKIIAINSENSFGRLDPMRPLIAIACGNRVYLFDMLRLGTMKNEFKNIFAAHSPRKIVHRSAQFSDYLTHTESCTLNNAFDTLMVHFALMKSRECLSLHDCFGIYFDLPEDSFDFTAKAFDFKFRPLKPDALMRSALNVQLLTELYWYFNDILMQPLRMATQQFSDIYPSIENQVDLMTDMNIGAYPGVENIDLNADDQLKETFETLLSE